MMWLLDHVFDWMAKLECSLSGHEWTLSECVNCGKVRR